MAGLVPAVYRRVIGWLGRCGTARDRQPPRIGSMGGRDTPGHDDFFVGFFEAQPESALAEMTKG
jgi:hypothetical protein